MSDECGAARAHLALLQLLRLEDQRALRLQVLREQGELGRKRGRLVQPQLRGSRLHQAGERRADGLALRRAPRESQAEQEAVIREVRVPARRRAAAGHGSLKPMLWPYRDAEHPDVSFAWGMIAVRT